jgi:lipoate---protein ligase
VIVLEYQRRTAKENMALDKELLENMAPGDEPVLHIYDWKNPSLTYGALAKPNKFLNFEALEEHGIDTARRATGGGMIFHIYDLAFSLIMPISHPKYRSNALENYVWINNLVQKALEVPTKLLQKESVSHKSNLNQFCMSKGTKYDIMVGDKKLYGAAQRRKKHAFLHQASISLFKPDFNLLHKILLHPDEICSAMQETSAYFFGDHQLSTSSRRVIHENIKQIFDS